MRLTSTLILAALVAAVNAQQPPQTPEPDYEVLGRGPLHEAFARPVEYDAAEGAVVNRAPPPMVDEIPPESRPEGDGVIWIPGYWAWDPDGNDFVWVSGLWRNAPPGRRWFPGYWQPEANDAWRWVAGFWGPAEPGSAVDPNPRPPTSLERGPSSTPPSEDHVWAPGHWACGTTWVWSPGFWYVPRDGWIWVPACYSWTPRGWIFVSGYWDRPIVWRGVVCAPVRFRSPVYRRPGWRLRPSFVVDTGTINLHLFASPHWQHYYYGDWYGAVACDIHPWHVFHQRRMGYDCIYAYHQWHARREGHWHENLVTWTDHVRRTPSARPPRIIGASDPPRRGLVALTIGIHDYEKRYAPRGFRRLDDRDRQRARRQADEAASARRQRQAPRPAGDRPGSSGRRPHSATGGPPRTTPGTPPPKAEASPPARKRPGDEKPAASTPPKTARPAPDPKTLRSPHRTERPPTRRPPPAPRAAPQKGGEQKGGERKVPERRPKNERPGSRGSS